MLLDVDVRPPNVLGDGIARDGGARDGGEGGEAGADGVRSEKTDLLAVVRRECVEHGRFVVLPALELAPDTPDVATASSALWRARTGPAVAAALRPSRWLRPFHAT